MRATMKLRCVRRWMPTTAPGIAGAGCEREMGGMPAIWTPSPAKRTPSLRIATGAVAGTPWPIVVTTGRTSGPATGTMRTSFRCIAHTTELRTTARGRAISAPCFQHSATAIRMRIAATSKPVKNGTAATEPPSTFGAAAARLQENGYASCTLLEAALERLPIHGRLTISPHVISELPAAVWCMRDQGGELAALLVAPIADAELAQRVEAGLAKRGLTRGPVRLGSDGVRIFPLQFTDAQPSRVEWRALDGAVRVLYREGDSSATIPLDGAWPAGTLLEVPYAKLPALKPADIEPLLAELNGLRHWLQEERKPKPRPTRAGWIGR